METFTQQWRPLADILGFINLGLITIIFGFGLRQIYVTRKGLRLAHERASKEKALEYSARFFGQFFPLLLTEGRAVKEQGLSFYAGPVGDFTPDSVPPDARTDAQRRREIMSARTCLDELELFAASFVIGVADEMTGYTIHGRFFCAAVGSVYDVISITRVKDNVHAYRPIVELYQIWAPRLTKEELTENRKRLDVQIKELPEGGMPPIGGRKAD